MYDTNVHGFDWLDCRKMAAYCWTLSNMLDSTELESVEKRWVELLENQPHTTSVPELIELVITSLPAYNTNLCVTMQAQIYYLLFSDWLNNKPNTYKLKHK